MSTVAELAKVEGDEAEAAEDDEAKPEETEQPKQPEETEQPEQNSQMTEQEAEREFKKLEKLAQTYLAKAMPIADRLGIPYQMCPLDYVPGLAVARAEHEVTSDVESAVLALIGKAAPVEFLESGEYEMCDKCGGWGEVLTGAKKEISRKAMCNPCGGKGYKPVVQPYVPSPPNGQPQYPGATVPFTPVAGGIPDQWGRPAGHVHWGIDPATIGV